MWLKVGTTALMIFSVAMLFGYVWIVGPQPEPAAPRAEKIEFLRRWATFIGLEAVALIGSIVGAYLIGRKARKEYREQSRRNMEALLEATLRDHGQKKVPDEDQI
jgi:hypothetical protein